MDEFLQLGVVSLVEECGVVPDADLLQDLVDEGVHLLAVLLHRQHHGCEGVFGQLEPLAEAQGVL